MIARLTPTAFATSSICASRTPRASKSSRVAAMIADSRCRRRSAAADRRRSGRRGVTGASDSASDSGGWVTPDMVRACNRELHACAQRVSGGRAPCRWSSVSRPHGGDLDGRSLRSLLDHRGDHRRSLCCPARSPEGGRSEQRLQRGQARRSRRPACRRGSAARGRSAAPRRRGSGSSAARRRARSPRPARAGRAPRARRGGSRSSRKRSVCHAEHLVGHPLERLAHHHRLTVRTPGREVDVGEQATAPAAAPLDGERRRGRTCDAA